VQRINTRGGAAQGGCDKAGDFRSVRYSADYVFLRRAARRERISDDDDAKRARPSHDGIDRAIGTRRSIDLKINPAQKNFLRSAESFEIVSVSSGNRAIWS
jgi:intergrase/recombinase